MAYGPTAAARSSYGLTITSAGDLLSVRVSKRRYSQQQGSPTKTPPLQPAWALGDAGHVRDLPVPVGIDELIIRVDNDVPDQRGCQ
jgi:hypothetical protein